MPDSRRPFPVLIFKKPRCLLGSYINHGVILYDVKGKWTHTPEKIETL